MRLRLKGPQESEALDAVRIEMRQDGILLQQVNLTSSRALQRLEFFDDGPIRVQDTIIVFAVMFFVCIMCDVCLLVAVVVFV
jgi:hypothetical protein